MTYHQYFNHIRDDDDDDNDDDNDDSLHRKMFYPENSSLSLCVSFSFDDLSKEKTIVLVTNKNLYAHGYRHKKKTGMFVALGPQISLCYSRCSTIEKPQNNVISAEQTAKFQPSSR